LTFRHLTRAAATIVLTAGISLPLAHGLAHAAIDDTADDAATTGFLDGVNTQDVVDSFVPTSTNVADCPAGTYHLLFRGEPVVNDATGAPVCVTADANGNVGSTVPGQPGQSGGDSNTEGDVTYGQLGEVPA
jgi:hypothetical protein